MGKVKKMSPYLLLGLGAAGAGAGAVFLSKDNREKAMNLIETGKKWTIGLFGGEPSRHELIEKAGRPDPYDLDDNKMVGEGAQFGVQYYNDKKH